MRSVRDSSTCVFVACVSKGQMYCSCTLCVAEARLWCPTGYCTPGFSSTGSTDWQTSRSSRLSSRKISPISPERYINKIDFLAFSTLKKFFFFLICNNSVREPQNFMHKKVNFRIWSSRSVRTEILLLPTWLITIRTVFYRYDRYRIVLNLYCLSKLINNLTKFSRKCCVLSLFALHDSKAS